MNPERIEGTESSTASLPENGSHRPDNIRGLTEHRVQLLMADGFRKAGNFGYALCEYAKCEAWNEIRSLCMEQGDNPHTVVSNVLRKIRDEEQLQVLLRLWLEWGWQESLLSVAKDLTGKLLTCDDAHMLENTARQAYALCNALGEKELLLQIAQACTEKVCLKNYSSNCYTPPMNPAHLQRSIAAFNAAGAREGIVALADRSVSLGDFQALKICHQALALPIPVEKLHACADALLRQGEFREAEKIFRQEIREEIPETLMDACCNRIFGPERMRGGELEAQAIAHYCRQKWNREKINTFVMQCMTVGYFRAALYAREGEGPPREQLEASVYQYFQGDPLANNPAPDGRTMKDSLLELLAWAGLRPSKEMLEHVGITLYEKAAETISADEELHQRIFRNKKDNGMELDESKMNALDRVILFPYRVDTAIEFLSTATTRESRQTLEKIGQECLQRMKSEMNSSEHPWLHRTVKVFTILGDSDNLIALGDLCIRHNAKDLAEEIYGRVRS